MMISTTMILVTKTTISSQNIVLSSHFGSFFYEKSKIFALKIEFHSDFILKNWTNEVFVYNIFIAFIFLVNIF